LMKFGGVAVDRELDQIYPLVEGKAQIWHFRMRSSGPNGLDGVQPVIFDGGASVLAHNGTIGGLGSASVSDSYALAAWLESLPEGARVASLDVVACAASGNRFVLASGPEVVLYGGVTLVKRGEDVSLWVNSEGWLSKIDSPCESARSSWRSGLGGEAVGRSAGEVSIPELRGDAERAVAKYCGVEAGQALHDRLRVRPEDADWWLVRGAEAWHGRALLEENAEEVLRWVAGYPGSLRLEAVGRRLGSAWGGGVDPAGGAFALWDSIRARALAHPTKGGSVAGTVQKLDRCQEWLVFGVVEEAETPLFGWVKAGGGAKGKGKAHRGRGKAEKVGGKK
jgi:hypothetical protein